MPYGSMVRLLDLSVVAQVQIPLSSLAVQIVFFFY